MSDLSNEIPMREIAVVPYDGVIVDGNGFPVSPIRHLGKYPTEKSKAFQESEREREAVYQSHLKNMRTK